MEEIKLYIISNEKNNENYSKSIESEEEEEIDDSNKTIEEKYKIWLKDLRILMNSCSYRKVLRQIEQDKDKFQLIEIQDIWKYKIIKLKAILRIIKKKLEKYKSEIKKENTHQSKSIKFWFNQAFFIFEELINDYTQENNKIGDKNYVNIITSIIEKYLEFFYLIILFYKEKNDVAKICIYLSFVDNFMPFMDYATNFNSIFLLQKLLLLRAKISLENKNYISSLEYQKIVIKLCFRILLFITNIYKGLDELYENSTIRNSLRKKIYLIFVNFLLVFYLRGITCEELNDLNRATKSYILCKWVYLKFLIDDNELFGIFINKIESNSISRIKIINDIRKIIEKRKMAQKRKIRKISLRLMDKNYKMFNDRYQSLFNSNKYKNISSNEFTINNKEKNYEGLENYLDKIGKKMFKEEENRNNNLIQKFTKSKYIISTLTMIDNLLSKDFKNILLKMDKIEIKKPKDDIKEIINKTIIKRRRRIFNSNLEKSRTAISTMNINNRNRELYENNNINSCKSSMIKREIDKFYDKNKKEIIFRSGVIKEIYYDGYQIINFTNGDIKQIFPDKTKQVYFFNESKIIQTTIPDEMQVFKFENGQIEKHFIDGMKEIIFPDGFIKKIYPERKKESINHKEDE
jgi:hypothetical protein